MENGMPAMRAWSPSLTFTSSRSPRTTCSVSSSATSYSKTADSLPAMSAVTVISWACGSGR